MFPTAPKTYRNYNEGALHRKETAPFIYRRPYYCSPERPIKGPMNLSYIFNEEPIENVAYGAQKYRFGDLPKNAGTTYELCTRSPPQPTDSLGLGSQISSALDLSSTQPKRRPRMRRT